MQIKNKYKVEERIAGQFGNKSKCFVITKLNRFGFYFDTNKYYFNRENAQQRCDDLNNGIVGEPISIRQAPPPPKPVI
jgi:hypothetical protein